MKSFIGLLLLLWIGCVNADAPFIDLGTHIHQGETISEHNLTSLVTRTADELTTQVATLTGMDKAEVKQRFVQFLFFVTDNRTLVGAKYLLNITEGTYNNSLPVNTTHYVNGEKVAIARLIFAGMHTVVTGAILRGLCGVSPRYLFRFGWPLFWNLINPSTAGLSEWIIYRFSEVLATTFPGQVIHWGMTKLGCDKAGDALYLFVTYTCFSWTHLSLIVGLFMAYSYASIEMEKKATDQRMKANETNTQMAVEATKSVAQTTNVMATRMDVMLQNMTSMSSMFHSVFGPKLLDAKPVQHIPSIPTPSAPVVDVLEGETTMTMIPDAEFIIDPTICQREEEALRQVDAELSRLQPGAQSGSRRSD